MRIFIVAVLIAFIVFWLLAIGLFSGVIPSHWLPSFLASLSRPDSFSGLGEAMGTLDGLFSSIAIVLGLIAILLQGKELRAATEAQALQAKALTEQICQQQASNRLGAFTARLSFLSAEIEHMENKIFTMVEQVETPKENASKEAIAELWGIIKNTRNKQKRYRMQAEEIDLLIQRMLNDKKLE